MTPSQQQIQDNTRKIIALTKEPLIDKLQKCMEENRKLRWDILELQAQLDRRLAE